MADAASHSTVFDSGLEYISGVYARSLLAATEKAGTSDAVVAELNVVVAEVFDRLPKFDATLRSPRVPFADKERMLDRAYSGKISATLLNFLKVLTRRGRFDCVRVVQRSLRRLLNELRGRVEVQVRSAVPLDQDTLGRVAVRLKEMLNRDVEISASVDAGLIGGLVVRVGDTVYDGSLFTHLVRLREETIRKSAEQLRQRSDRFVVAD